MRVLVAFCLALSGCNGCDSNGMGGMDMSPAMCTGDHMLCSGLCVDLTSDAKNCGSCGNACSATGICCAGTCVETTTCGFAVTKVSPINGYQNGGDYINLEGAGFASGMRVFLGDGRAPVRVQDASHALVQLPPGPPGATDVKITLGGLAATTPGAFTYVSAGLDTTWAQKPMMHVRGEDPGVGVLKDGRVLVAGGTTVPDDATMAVDTAEIYERISDTVTPAANTMATKRWHSSVIPLLNGKALIVGGACGSDAATCNGDSTLADLFDPATNTFTPTSMPLTRKRAYTRSVLLVDGRVLIGSSNDPTMDLYDPDTDTFTNVPHTAQRIFGFMVRLRDGRVLYGSGDASVTTAEVFDSDTGTFTPVGSLMQGRSMLTAHTLPDGRALIIGGASMSAGGVIDPQNTMEVFDPMTNGFSLLPYTLMVPRCWHASALVRDGTVLVMGGYPIHASCTPTDAVEQVDPVAGTVKTFANLPNTNTEWTAVTMFDGSVLAVGGGACGTSSALPDLDFLPGAPNG